MDTFSQAVTALQDASDRAAMQASLEKMALRTFQLKACLQGSSQMLLDSDSDSEQVQASEDCCHSDSSDDTPTHPVNTVCSHESCQAQETCIVAELETVRDNYTKGRDQFQIKVCC